MSQLLRIAYLADANSVHSRRWIADFAERGHEVHLLVDDRDEVRPGLPDGAALHRYRRFGGRRLPVISSLQGRGSLRRALQAIKPDILHAHYLTRYGWQARLSGFHPYVVSPWGSDLFVTARRSLRARLWARATLNGADLVTIMSDQMRAEVARYGVPAERIQRIAFGVDTQRHAPDPDARTPPIVGGRRFVFAPRAIASIYRPDVVIEAFALLPPELVLVMTTRNAEAAVLADTERRIARNDLSGRVLLVESIDEEMMLTLFQTAAAVVSVPESDAVSISVLEAMACARPVVATDLPGTREHLGAAAPQLLVEVGDVAGTAGALRKVVEMSPDEAARLGAALRADVIARADRRRSIERLERLYHDLLGSRR